MAPDPGATRTIGCWRKGGGWCEFASTPSPPSALDRYRRSATFLRARKVDETERKMPSLGTRRRVAEHREYLIDIVRVHVR